MANPNIVNVTSIFGKTVIADVGTSYAVVVSNSVSSGKVFKINTIIAANVDGTSAADISVRLISPGSPSSANLASTISVPADSTLVILDKSSSLYLEEGWAIHALASAVGDIQLIISYEEIS